MSDALAHLHRPDVARDERDEGEPELVTRLRADIAERGPITVARFMERALYEPALGYYRRSAAAPGRQGDFLTAPEAHPLFGASIGLLAERVWDRLDRPDPFVVLEPGAGAGALALGLLDGLRRTRSPLLDAVRYVPADVEAERVRTTRERLADAGFAAQAMDAAREGSVSLVVANEVVDALPVHRVVQRGSELRERVVTLAGDRFEEIDGPPADPLVAAQLAREGVRLEDGQLAEVCLGLEAWVREVTADVSTGVLVVVDYAHEAGELYGPGRSQGTLRGFYRHRLVADPYRRPGRQDMTAHVDLTALRAAVAWAGLDHLGTTTQAELLVALGAGDLVAARLRDPDADLHGALELRSALARLLDPRGMGGFAVAAFGRGVGSEPLPGFERLRRSASS